MNNFLKYLFSPLPGVKFSFYPEFLIFIGILIIAAVIIKIISKKYKNPAFKKCFGGVPSKLVLFIFIIGFLIFSRYEHIAFFSMRFMLYLSLLVFLYWAGKQAYTFFTKYREESKKMDVIKSTPRYSTKK